VKHLFLVLVDLCKRTAQLAHPLPKSQVGNTTPIPQLHFIDGQFSVAPEVVEASLGPHMQKLPRPRGADAPGLLMRELELHPPSEEWNRRTLSGGPWSGMLEAEVEVENLDPNPIELWPRKRRRVEHDVGFGLCTVVGLSSFSTLLGSRRDVISSVWKPAGHGIWHKVFSLPLICICFAPTCHILSFVNAMGEQQMQCHRGKASTLDFEFNSLQMDILEPPYRESISWILKDVLCC
jgi:hypothetical protein